MILWVLVGSWLYPCNLNGVSKVKSKGSVPKISLGFGIIIICPYGCHLKSKGFFLDINIFFRDGWFKLVPHAVISKSCVCVCFSDPVCIISIRERVARSWPPPSWPSRHDIFDIFVKGHMKLQEYSLLSVQRSIWQQVVFIESPYLGPCWNNMSIHLSAFEMLESLHSQHQTSHAVT